MFLISVSVFTISSIPYSFSQSVSNVDDQKISYFIRDISDPRPGYPLFDESGKIDFWLDFKSVDNFERQMFDWSKPGAPKISLSDKLPETARAKLESQQEPFIERDSKISPALQRNLHFVMMYLGQSMTADAIGNLYYKVHLEVEDSRNLPDYVYPKNANDKRYEVLDAIPQGNEELISMLEPLAKNHVTVTVPISSIPDLMDDANIKKIQEYYIFEATDFNISGVAIPDELQFKSERFINPNQQLINNIPPIHVKCNGNMTIMLKSSDLSPICVSPFTSQKLLDRNVAFEV